MPGQTVLVIDDSATIVKVVELVLTKAGYRVHGALSGEEGLQMARELKPDLVLLDFVMPTMNGYQVCRSMAESIELSHVPVVLMSAKGDEIGERFVKVMGIVDYITKPFSPEAIVAVVGHVMAEREALSVPASFDASAPPALDGDRTGEVHLPPVDTDPSALDELEEDDLEDERTNSRPGLGAHGVRLAAGPLTRRRILAAIRDAAALAAARDNLVGDEIADRVRARLTDEVLEAAVGRWIVEPPKTAAPEAEARDVLSGDLTKVPIAQVLVLLEEQRQSGILTVRRARLDGKKSGADPIPPASTAGKEPTQKDPREKSSGESDREQRVEICFRGGRVDFAGGEGLGAEFLLGNYILEREAMSREDLELFFRSRGTTSRLFGEQLLKLNYLGEDDLRQALARQTCERIYEVLRWSSGHFSFRASDATGAQATDGPPGRKAALGLHVETILVEGLRRVDEWHLIEREIDNLDGVFLPSDDAAARLPTGTLTRDEAVVLELVNGRNTVRDIVRQSRLGTFEVSQLLYRLKTVQLIRRRVQPVAV